MVLGVEVGKFFVSPVNRHGVLDQVVGADAEKVRFPGEVVGEDGRRRHLYHDARLDGFVEGHVLGPEVFLGLLKDVFCRTELLEARDHGKEDADPAVGAGPENGPELDLEDLLPVQAEPDGPVAQEGVLLFGDGEVVHLLVPPDVKGPDDHRPSLHGLHHVPVLLELGVLGGEEGAVEIEKFRPVEPHALAVVLEDVVQVLRGSHVGLEFDLHPVKGDRLQSPDFREAFLEALVPIQPLPVAFHRLPVGVHIHLARFAVDDHEISVFHFVEELFHSHDGRDFQSPGEYGGVGCLASRFRRHAQGHLPVHLGDVRGSKLPRHDDGRLPEIREVDPADLEEQLDHPVGDVLHIVGPGLHIIVSHAFEDLDKAVSHLLHRPFGVDAPVEDHALDLADEIRILQHHAVGPEDGRFSRSDGFEHPGIGLADLLSGKLEGGAKAFELLFRIFNELPEDVDLFFPVNDCPANGYARRGSDSFHDGLHLPVGWIFS